MRSGGCACLLELIQYSRQGCGKVLQTAKLIIADCLGAVCGSYLLGKRHTWQSNCRPGHSCVRPVQADEIQQEAQRALQAAKLKGAELEEAEQQVANAEKHARDLETAGRGQEAMIAAAAANQCVCFSQLQLSSASAPEILTESSSQPGSHLHLMQSFVWEPPTCTTCNTRLALHRCTLLAWSIMHEMPCLLWGKDQRRPCIEQSSCLWQSHGGMSGLLLHRWHKRQQLVRQEAQSARETAASKAALAEKAASAAARSQLGADRLQKAREGLQQAAGVASAVR